MFAKEITVLAVDDEPDVLSVTKLALRSMKVGGLPLKVYTASSKAEAIELLNGPLGVRPKSQNLPPYSGRTPIN